VPVEIEPEPSEAERRAILAALALEEAAAAAPAGRPPQAAELGGEPLPEERGSDAGVVEP
jgi:hypothetical protein